MASLRWGEVDDVNLSGQDFDLVLTSDVVYHDPLTVFFFLIFKRFFLFSFDSEFIFVKKKKTLQNVSFDKNLKVKELN